MNEYNYNFKNKNNPGNARDKSEKLSAIDNGLLNALVYIVIIMTVLMTAPLVYKLADYIYVSGISSSGDKESSGEKITKHKNYSVTENPIDISELRNTEFGRLGIVSAKITDGGDIILFCSARIEISAETNEEDGVDEEIRILKPPEYEDIMRIAAIKNGGLEISARIFRDDFLHTLRNKEYVFKDYGDGTFFLSNSQTAFLFDLDRMRIAASYVYPKGYNIYQTALSNNKEMLAVAAERGFFVCDMRNSNMTVTEANMKELITAVKSGEAVMTARNPVWFGDDQRIFYRLYADNFVTDAGVTAASPGGNERLAALDAKNFIFFNEEYVFYYLPINPETDGSGDLFKCGYFSLSERKMTEAMQSKVNYYDIAVSHDGTLFAALSESGNAIKISVIDIQQKKIIYHALYEDMHGFSFSPDGKNLIIYGTVNGERNLRVIAIDWTEE